jgi:ATP-dependent helicase/nuclease subunit A
MVAAALHGSFSMTVDSSSRDDRARLAAMAEFERPLVLEAGAGTGKTTTLVNRILAWTLGRGWDETADELDEPENNDSKGLDRRERIAAAVLEGVTAITFTDAAAAEMAARVAKGLAAIVGGRFDELPGFEPDVLDAAAGATLEERATALLGRLDLLQASTIHAFCYRILRSHPLEIGLHPTFRIDGEEREIEAAIREVVETSLPAAYASDTSPLLAAGTLGLGPRELHEALFDLTRTAFPATALDDDPFASARVVAFSSELETWARKFVDLADGRLESLTKRSNAPKVVGALRETIDFLAHFDAGRGESASSLCAFIGDTWPDNLLNHLKNWGGRKGFNKSELEALEDRGELLKPLCRPLHGRLKSLTGLDPERLRAFASAVRPLLAETERALRAGGLACFEQVLVDTKRLLESSPQALAQERRKIRQLLVDEFQDTDPVQCRIVSLLAFGDEPERNPGLFVVGDPKQSIYGWRSADLEAYEGFLDLVRDRDGQTFNLTQNFRSAPVILEEVDRTLSGLMRKKAGLQPGFVPLVPSQKTSNKTGCRVDSWAPVEGWVVCSVDALETGAKQEITTHEAREIEADAVARDILALEAAGHVTFKDVAVLLRQQTNLDILLEAFRQYGVRYVVTSDKKYYQRREIIDAVALVRTIVDPTDQVALVTWLRSTAVGVPDAALIPLWRHGFPEAVIATEDADIESLVRRVAVETPGTIPGIEHLAGWEEGLLAAVEHVTRLRRSFHEESSEEFVERLRRSTLIEAHEAARFLGQYRVANLDRFFRHLQRSIEETRGNVQKVLRALRRSVSDAHEAQEALPREAAEDAVQVMTIHKAKGLEFDHVYLLDLDAGRGSGSRASTETDRRPSDDGPREYVLQGERTMGFATVEERRQLVEEAERVRLLYVAMTRARERLVLSGGWGVRRLWGGDTTFTSLLTSRPGLPESWEDTAREADQGTGWADVGDIRWKFPRLGDVDSGDVPAGDPKTLPDKIGLQRDSKKLAALSDLARRRMRRRLFEPASERERDAEDAPAPGELGGGRTAAQAVGHAIHAALERWDLEADPGEELARQRPLVLQAVHGAVCIADHEDAAMRAELLLERLASGSLLARLRSFEDRIIGREVPVTLAAKGEPDGPLVGYTGIADLVLRSESDEKLVVIDYKTDSVDTDAAVAERVQQYAPQLEVYSRALESALGLGYRPGYEIWFIWPDTVWKSS